jgi:hypothetical protein
VRNFPYDFEIDVKDMVKQKIGEKIEDLLK